jgi:protein TonB
MKQSKIRLFAITTSVMLHAVWFIQSGNTPDAKQTGIHAHAIVTRLTFAAPEPITRPEPVAFQEPMMEPLPKPEPVTKKLKPASVKKPKPVKKKRPVLIAKRKMKSVAEEIDKPSVPAEPVQVASVPAAIAPPALAPTEPTIDEGLLEQERQRYLAGLIAHIEQHKWYPRAARRRGLQGEVKISFLLLADGSIRHIEVKKGPKLLRTAAARAVAKAEPMPMPPANIDCPFPCEFSMRFALN